MKQTLLPTYWTLGRRTGGFAEEDLLRDWESILESRSIRPTGKNLDWLQRLSPLADTVFLAYGKPFGLFKPSDPELATPVVSFGTCSLMMQGGFTSRNPDSRLWWKLYDTALQLAHNRAGSLGLETEELMELFRAYAARSVEPTSGLREHWESFVRTYTVRACRQLETESLAGEEALVFLASLNRQFLLQHEVEIYFPGRLSLDLATDIQVPGGKWRQPAC